MKFPVRRVNSTPSSTDGGEVNQAFDQAGEEVIHVKAVSQLDNGILSKTQPTNLTQLTPVNETPSLHDAVQNKEDDQNIVPCSQEDHIFFVNECPCSPAFSGDECKCEGEYQKDNSRLGVHDNVQKPRHENGHLVLGNSVSSYVERLQESEDLSSHSPLDRELSHSSDVSSPRGSRHSITSQPGDSGVCSEANSGVSSYFHVLVNNNKDDLDDSTHCCEHNREDCFDQHPDEKTKQPRDSHPEIITGKLHEHSSKQQKVLNNTAHLSKSGNEPVLLNIGNYPVNSDLNISPSNNNSLGIRVSFHDHSSSEEQDGGEHPHHHSLYKKHKSGRDQRSFQDKHHPPPKQDEKDNRQPGRKKMLQNEKAPSEPFWSKYTSCRWKLAYLCFLARFVQTALRQLMGIAIVGMTLQNEVLGNNSISVTRNATASNHTQTEQEFSWSSGVEGVILSSFNMGSIITPIIVGYLTTRYGGRKLMTVCLVAGGMFTVLLPFAARAHVSLIIVFRIITGMALSGTDSLIQAMLARWAPLYEKASLSSCAFTGLSVAGVLTFLVCGYLATIGGEGKGWPYIFYLFGLLCLLLAPLWYFTVYDGPEKHPRITRKERAIISYNKEPQRQEEHKEPLNIPWKRILKCPAVGVILMGHITHKWILSFMLSYLPRYFADLFDFGMEMDGMISSLPFLGRIVSGIIAGYLSDWMLVKGVSTGKTRKVFQGAGCFGCAICSLFIACIPSLSKGWSISLLVLALSFQNLTSVAFRINLLDIAPRYAGLLNGVISTIATVVSLPAPVLTSLLIAGGSRQGWSVVFYLVAALNIVGGLIFVLFARGEIQEWAKSSYKPHPKDSVCHEPDICVPDLTPKTFHVVNGKPLREVKSFPASMRRHSTNRKEKLGRRATLDVGSFIKRVQSEAFTNLALADL